jgi:hypothetical protein
MFFFYV